MTSAIISSVAKELGARISYEVGLIWNAKEDLQNLKSEFEAIQAVAEVADGLPYLKNEEVKDWLQKLKDVAYDAEDVIDEYQAKSAKDDHKRMLVRGKRVCTDPFTLVISCFRKHLVHRYQLGKKIKAMNDRLGQISKERMRYTLEGMEAAAAEKRRAVGSNRATASLMVEEDIVGRDSDRDDLVKKLLSEDLIMCGKSSSVPIVSIVGIGGLGKTTLARMIFNDNLVEGHFEECRWWICVSQCVDAEDLSPSNGNGDCDRRRQWRQQSHRVGGDCDGRAWPTNSVFLAEPSIVAVFHHSPHLAAAGLPLTREREGRVRGSSRRQSAAVTLQES